MDFLDGMLRWENGELDEAETIILFQGLIDSGTVWHLQGMYGREALRLIHAELCHP